MPNDPLHHRANRYALKLALATRALHVRVTITRRRWWHNVALHSLWMREWAGVIR